MSVMFGSTSSVSVKRCEERSFGSVIVSSNLAAAAFPVGCTQFSFHDLADSTARKRRTKLHGDKALRLAELAVGPFPDFVRRRRRPRRQDRERHRRFAPLVARHA